MKRAPSIGLLIIACALPTAGADRAAAIHIPVFVPELKFPRIEVESPQLSRPLSTLPTREFEYSIVCGFVDYVTTSYPKAEGLIDLYGSKDNFLAVLAAERVELIE